MKKFAVTLVFILLVGFTMIWISNSSLFGIIDCHCYADNDIMLSCERYCTIRGSSCTYFELKGSQCFSGFCSQTWKIGCENKRTTEAGANKACDDCIEDDDDNGTTSHHFFTPWW